VVVLVALAPLAQAAERITLRNGFEVRCHHHAESEGRTRLYLSAGEDNYIEFPPEEIAAVETVSDPPPTLKSVENAPAASAPATQDARLSPADVHEMLVKAGQEHNVDVDLLASLVKAESGGNSRALSRTGARGLMQLMPGTAKDMGVADSFRPEQNVRGGSAYLDALLIRYHDNMALALAAYNAGPAAVDKYHGIPPYRETQAYVARVIHEFNRRVAARSAQARQSVALAAQAKNSR
jgi:soluble lytic murein transglycosylase-like protein